MKKSVFKECVKLIKKYNKEYNFGINIPQKATKKFRNEFADKANWCYISCNWHYISCKQEMSEDFIREFADKVHWAYISRDQKLSEGFIREFSDKVNWRYISEHAV